MLSGANPAAKAGCSIGGKCKICPHYRSMPFDVSDPVTGDIIKSGTVFDCVFAWIMMGSWDAGRQSQGTHAAVAEMHGTIFRAMTRADREQLDANNQVARLR